MDPISGKEKEEAATCRFSKSKSAIINKAFFTMWIFVVLLLPVLVVCWCNCEYPSIIILFLWDSIPLEVLLPNTSKESMFLFCNLILLLVLADAGLFLGHPVIVETRGRWRHKINDDSNIRGSSSTEGSDRQVAIVGKGSKEELPEQEQEQEQDQEREAPYRELVDGCLCDGEELDRRCDEFISNFKRERRMEAMRSLVELTCKSCIVD